jgi:hypothetical protein
MNKVNKILRQAINEEISKREVEDLINSEFEKKMKSKDFERLINRITADALGEFFDKLWMKKQFIKDCIKN